jgi:hypothetical protein
MKEIMGENKMVSPKNIMQKLIIKSLLLILILNDNMTDSSIIQRNIND